MMMPELSIILEELLKYLFGICFGELTLSVIYTFRHFYYDVHRQRLRRRRRRSNHRSSSDEPSFLKKVRNHWLKNLPSNNWIKLFYSIIILIALIYLNLQNVLTGFFISILWILYVENFGALRLFEHESIFKESQRIGYGLSLSYWDGYLHYVATRDSYNQLIEDVENNYVHGLEELTDYRLFLLIPEDCDMPGKDDLDELNMEILPLKDDVGVKVPERRFPIKGSVAKFYDENKEHPIVIRYDFPQALKSGMGPKWNMNPNSVKANINIFIDDLKKRMEDPFYECQKNNIVFVVYKKNEDGCNLYQQINKKINNELRDVVSSDSGLSIYDEYDMEDE